VVICDNCQKTHCTTNKEGYCPRCGTPFRIEWCITDLPEEETKENENERRTTKE
jgi:predicted amidophosphoribosyltransferase